MSDTKGLEERAGWEIEGFIDRLTKRNDTNDERLVLETISHLRGFSRDCDSLRDALSQLRSEREAMEAELRNLVECLELAKRNGDDLPLPFAGYGRSRQGAAGDGAMSEQLSRAAVFAESLGKRSLGEAPTGWHWITEITQPTLFEALDAITHDGGGGCHGHYNVPSGWIAALPRMETLLGRLSFEQRQVIAIGECSEQDALVREFDGLDLVHRFLNAFFEDFIERESVDAA